MSLENIDLLLPRHAFSIRDVARAGEVWRSLQDTAVLASTRCGWPPQRYSSAGCAFVVREQTVVHHREIHFGEAIQARTWVERFRREIFSTRQTRFSIEGKLVTSATQEWVHVSTEEGKMRAARASRSLLDSFPAHVEAPLVELPAFSPVDGGQPFTFTFTAWHTRMDPLDHANHPAYVDWCEEAIARQVEVAGMKPVDVVPVAERVRYKAGVFGGDEVRLQGCLLGKTPAGDAVIGFKIRVDGKIKAETRLVRRMTRGAGSLLATLRGDT